MIYVNNEAVTLDGDDKYSKEYKAGVEEIKKLGFPVKFKAAKGTIHHRKMKDGSTSKTFAQQFIPYTSISYGDDGAEEWTYSKTPPMMKNEEMKFPKSGEWLKKPTFSFGKQDIDKIFFFLYKSRIFYKYKMFEVVDDKARANKDFKEKVDAAKLNNILYSQDSVLLKDEEKLKTVAKAWNVHKVDSLTKEQIILKLENKLKKDMEEDSNIINEFIESTGLDDFTKLRAIVQQSIDNGVLRYNARKFGFYFCNIDGTDGERIMKISRKDIDIKEEKLSYYLKDNPDKLDTIKLNMGIDEDDDFNPDDIDSLEWEDLKHQAKKVGMRVQGVKKDNLIQQLKDHYDIQVLDV